MAATSPPSGSYYIPKPYGEIYSWRLYRRDQTAPSEHPLAYYFYSLSLFRSNDKNMPTTLCETLFTDDRSYVLQHFNDIFYLVIQKSLTTPFIAGDWLSLTNALPYTTKLHDRFPLVQIQAVLQPNMGVGYEDAYVTIELVRPQHAEFRAALKKFCDNNTNPLDNTADNIREGHAVVTCTKVRCVFSGAADWGWTGDPRDVTTRCRNKVPEEDWYLQVVCIDARHSSNRDSDKARGFSRIASAQWASLGVVKQTLETAAKGIVEKLAINHSATLKQRFVEFYKDAQIQLNKRAMNTFGQMEWIPGQPDRRMGGYVLLQCVSAKPTASRNNNNTKRLRLMPVPPEVVEEEEPPLYAASRGSQMDAADTDFEFELVAGNLTIEEEGEMSKLVALPPDVGISTEDAHTLFQSQQSSDNMRILSSTVSRQQRIREEVRFRLHTIDREPNIKDDVIDMQSYDRQSVPFEYDIHYDSDTQFIQEFNTFVEVVTQCLVATTNTPSFEERAKPFEPVEIPSSSDTYNRAVRAIDKHVVVLNESNSTAQLKLYTLDLNSETKKQTFTRLVNEMDPWVHPKEREMGACAALLWQPSVDIAMGTRSMPIEEETMYRALTTVTPFGNLTPQRATLVQNIATKAKTKLIEQFTNQKRFILKQLDADTLAAEYTPLVLDYGIRVDATTNPAAPAVTWSLGSSVSLMMEAVEMCLLVLQLELYKINQDPAHPNCIREIQAREKKAKLDTYPLGFMSDVQCQYAQCGRPTVKTNTVCMPGQPDFYQHRDYAYKEIQYADSLFDVQQLDVLDETHVSGVSKNRWSGLCGLLPSLTAHSGSNALAAVYNTTESMGGPLRWLPNPSTTVSKYTGVGVWQGSEPLTLAKIIHGRYRSYTGVCPQTQISRHEMETDPQQQYAATVIGPQFDTTEENIKLVHPAIKATTLLNETLPDFLVDNFVGWHYSNERALNRTVFALACGKFYDQIESFFTELDPIYHEPRGINILQGPRTPEKVFIGSLLNNVPKRTLLDLNRPPIMPAVVRVKDSIPTSIATLCTVHGYYVKTESFRMIESEVWTTLNNFLTEIRHAPTSALPNCLYTQLRAPNRRSAGSYRMQQLLQMRPTCVTVLSRLFVAITIYDTVRRNNQSYRIAANITAGVYDELQGIE